MFGENAEYLKKKDSKCCVKCEDKKGGVANQFRKCAVFVLLLERPNSTSASERTRRRSLQHGLTSAQVRDLSRAVT